MAEAILYEHTRDLRSADRWKRDRIERIAIERRDQDAA